MYSKKKKNVAIDQYCTYCIWPRLSGTQALGRLREHEALLSIKAFPRRGRIRGPCLSHLPSVLSGLRGASACHFLTCEMRVCDISLTPPKGEG